MTAPPRERTVAVVHCGACGNPVELASGERVGFRDECSRCRADLHACRNCAHFDPGAYNQCREPNAERVADRDRANRCDWFAAGTGGPPVRDPAERSRAALDQLFKSKKP